MTLRCRLFGHSVVWDCRCTATCVRNNCLYWERRDGLVLDCGAHPLGGLDITLREAARQKFMDALDGE